MKPYFFSPSSSSSHKVSSNMQWKKVNETNYIFTLFANCVVSSEPIPELSSNNADGNQCRFQSQYWNEWIWSKRSLNEIEAFAYFVSFCFLFFLLFSHHFHIHIRFSSICICSTEIPYLQALILHYRTYFVWNAWVGGRPGLRKNKLRFQNNIHLNGKNFNWKEPSKWIQILYISFKWNKRHRNPFSKFIFNCICKYMMFFTLSDHIH